MAKPSAAKKVAAPLPTPTQSLTVVTAPSFEDDAGVGLENVTSKDLLIPRLTIVQSLSPQVIKSKPEFIPGCQVGDIIDVGTGELLPAPITVLPVHFLKQWLEWAPRQSGKGLVEVHNDASILDDCTKDADGHFLLNNGNYVQETAQFFVLNLSADGRRSFIGMAVTQLKQARKWLTLATSEKLKRADGTMFTPPLFYRSYQLSTREESNAKGTWSNWKIERHVALPELEDWQNLRQEAIDFRTSIAAGEVKADVASMDTTANDGEAM